MENPTETLVEIRKDHMVSPNGGKPNCRIAHFLSPSFSSIDDQALEFPSLSPSSLPPTFEPKKWPLKVSFTGWRYNHENWKTWVDKMVPQHQSTWKRAGIFEAILSSTCKIQKDQVLLYGIAEKWCCETRSFVFCWGEATITLEDVMILGGLSVVGDSVLGMGSTKDMGLKAVEKKLTKARTEFSRTKSRKASPSLWLNMFMESGSEIEHEAFLAFWLSEYVFSWNHTIREQVFPLAARLARGNRIALAPAVLASIYRDLTLLKEKICALNACENEGDVLELAIRSPFHLVQIWVWERFPGLRPKPNPLQNGQTRLARWGNLEYLKIENLRLAIETSGESFQWRPYTKTISNWNFPKFYAEQEVLLFSGSGSDEELRSFARCLKVSELVGIDCVEQYLPHRVAMQFGFDQDIPGSVIRFDETPEIAWNYYSKEINKSLLFIPARLFEADVTTRYLEWWKKQCVLVQQGTRKCTRPQTGISESSDSERPIEDLVGKYGLEEIKQKAGNEGSEYSKKSLDNLECKRRAHVGSDPTKSSKREKEVLDLVFPQKSPKGKKRFSDVSPKRLEKSQQISKGNIRGKDPLVPPGFPPKCGVQANNITKEDQLTISQILESTKKHKNDSNRKANDPETDSNPFRSFSSSKSVNWAVQNLEPETRRVEEDIMKTEAAMKESKTQESVENEALGNQEIQKPVGNQELGDEESMEFDPFSSDVNEGESCRVTLDTIPQLEEKISRLESLIAGLKAAKFGQGVKKTQKSC